MIDYRISLKETMIIKGIAICAMLVHHLFFEYPEYGVIPYQTALVGKVCVAMFVFLSGYGLTVQCTKIQENTDSIIRGGKTWLKFLCKRFVKFYLNYWTVFLIAVPLGIFVFGRSLSDAYGESASVPLNLFADVLGIQGFSSYNITWWFNRLIIVLYLMFPVLYMLMRNKYTTGLTLAVLFSQLQYVLLPSVFRESSSYFYIFTFALGMSVAKYAEQVNRLLSGRSPQTVFLLSLTAVFALCIVRQTCSIRYVSGIGADPFITVFTALAVVALCRMTGCGIGFMAFLGRHSMNIYMIHTFISGYFFHDFIYGLKYPVLMFAALLSASIIISALIETIKGKCGFYRLEKYTVNLLQ